MNKAAFLHQPDSRYCFAVSDQELVLRLRVAKEDRNLSISVIHGNKYEYRDKRQETQLQLSYVDHLHAYFEAHLTLEDTRLAYVFKVEEEGQAYYYHEAGFTQDYDFDTAYYSFFQMPYINAADVHRLVDWAPQAVFYQIFVDRFYRGDKDKDDTYINMAWTDKPLPRSFAGGDLEGIRQKLDYLQELGINTIYLTPIFESASNHKYDTLDYYQVDKQFGGNISFKRLVQDLHARGMRIVLDAVFNHTSDRFPFFQDVIEKGNASAYYDWYMVDGEEVSQQPLNYQTFAAVSQMPKLNTSHPAVQDYLLDITRHWTKEYQLDGWRLDVSDEVSHDFWRRFRKVVKEENPQAIIIGENWHDATPYLMGDQFDGIMNYAFTKACLDYFADQSISSQEMAEQLNQVLVRNTSTVNQMNLNLLDSHDTHRFLTKVGADADKLLASLALLFIFVGMPCLYYGTEIGMEGQHDPDCRRGFNWEEETWNHDLLELVKKMTTIKQDPVLQHGNIAITAEGTLLRVKRSLQGQTIELIINKGETCSLCPSAILLANGFKDGQLVENGFVLQHFS